MKSISKIKMEPNKLCDPKQMPALGLNPWEQHCCIGPRKLMFSSFHQQQAQQGKSK